MIDRILSQRQNFLQNGLLLLCFSLLSWNLVRHAQAAPFSEDEVTHLERSIFYDLYIQGDFQNEHWQSFDSYDMPKFADLAFGAFLAFHSQSSAQSYLVKTTFLNEIESKGGDWRFEAESASIFNDYLLHIQKAAQPIIVARLYTLLFFSIPTLILIFYLGKTIIGWNFGLISMTLIGGNNLFVRSMSQAMCESSLFFFIFLSGCLSLKWLSIIQKKTSRLQMIMIILLTGVSTGLATSSKLNGALSLIFVSLLYVYTYYKKKISFKLLFFSLLTLFAVSFSIFVLTNPFVWSNPTTKSLYLLQHRDLILKQQQHDPKTAASALTNLYDRITTTYDRTLGTNGWYTNFGSTSHFVTIDLIMFSYGLFILKRRLEDTSNYHLDFLGIWLSVLLLTTLPVIPLDWDRYYLPIVVVVSSVQALTIEKLTRLIKFKMS